MEGIVATPSSKSPVPGGRSLSAVITNFNGLQTLPKTIDSLLNYPMFLDEVIVVDDGSTDESVSWLRRRHPGVRVVEMGKNSANMAKVRNAGIRAARGSHVFLLDNDIELIEGCLENLFEVMLADPKVFCVTPRLVHDDDRTTIYMDGNGMHFLAMGTGPRRGASINDVGVLAPMPTCGCGIMLLDVALCREIGLFDEGYALGWADDGEFQLRGAMYGYKALHVSAAMCTHEAKQHGARRGFGQFHNRIRVLCTFYRARTLLLLAPSLILFELLLILGSVVGGFAGAYVKAVRKSWAARANLLATRREMQSRRKVSDPELFWDGAMELPGAVKPRPMTRLLVRVFEVAVNANWRLVRLFS